MLYSCYSLRAVYYLFTAYTERAFLQLVRLFKHPLKDDVSIRLNKLDNHLKQIQCLLLDSNNNDVVKSLIRETMYFIEWIAPDIEFNYAFELANSEVWNNIEARNQIIDELGTWNDRVLQMSQLLTL
jgi:hypothetical protein